MGEVVPSEVRSSARRVSLDCRRSRQRTATIGVFGFATVQSVRSALANIKRARLSDERAACCADGFLSLVALAESVLRPGGWENMCRLMCHCVRHIGLDNKHGRSVEAIHSFLSRWTACTELSSGTQGEPRCKKSSMGSENRQRCSPRFRKSDLMRSVPPRFDRAARKTRRALVAFLRL